MAGPLEGTKVLSFGRMLSGPYATMLLADLGAEVVKIEVPKIGDLARFASPFIDKLSSYFLSINRGKKSITLDLKKERAKKEHVSDTHDEQRIKERGIKRGPIHSKNA